MAETGDWHRNLRVLRNKRDATRYLILVQIAERQPAVSQSEIAETLGITPQAVSEYLNGLVEHDFVKKRGRGRWEITAKGVNWLISETEELSEFTRHVWEEVIEQGGIETAIAETAITEGEQVTLSMEDGYLRARPGDSGPATATAVTSAEAYRDLAVTDFKGLLDFSLGHVTIIEVPPAQDGGSGAISENTVETHEKEADIVAIAGVEAAAALHTADIEPDIRFGTTHAVQEATLKGLDVLLVSVSSEISRHTDQLHEYDISYDVIAVDES